MEREGTVVTAGVADHPHELQLTLLGVLVSHSVEELRPHTHKDMKRQTPVTHQSLHNAGWSVTADGSKSVIMKCHIPVKLMCYLIREEIVQ